MASASLKVVTAVLAASLWLPIVGNTTENVYKWVDEKGITHYSERAPDGTTGAEKVKTYGPPSTRYAPSRPTLGDSGEKKATGKKLGPDGKELDEQTLAQYQGYCSTAKDNIKTLNEHARVRTKGDDGQMRYLSDEEKSQAVSNNQRAIEDYCGF